MRTAVGALLLLGCTHRPVEPQKPASVPPPRAKLAVVVVIDDFPWWAFEEARAKFDVEGGGLGRLVAHGTVGPARYPYLTTLTGPGHATLSTGLPPRDHAIAANRNVMPTGERLEVSSVENRARLLSPGVKLLGDPFVAAGGYALSVSIKDRAALLLSATSTDESRVRACYPATEGTGPGGWTCAFPRGLEVVWEPISGETGFAGPHCVSTSVGGPWKDFGIGFPHRTTTSTTEAPTGYAPWAATPQSARHTLDLALAAVDAAQLGADEHPDLLAVSLTASDIVGHCFGNESAEYRDILLQIDRELGRFFAALDERHLDWVVAISADHGAIGGPDGQGGRVGTQILSKGPLVALNLGYDDLWLTNEASTVADQLEAARKVAGVRDVCTCEAKGSARCADATLEPVAAMSCGEPQVGDGLVVVQQGHLLGTTLEEWTKNPRPDRYWAAGSHGSVYDYDRVVPLGFLGVGVAGPAVAPEGDPRDLAPRLTALVGLPAPNP